MVVARAVAAAEASIVGKWGGRMEADHQTPGASYQDSPDLFRALRDLFPWTPAPFLGGRERILADVCGMVGDERHQERGARL
jgi:hypothetical protein